MELDGISITHPIGKRVQTNGNRRNRAQSLTVIKDIKERQNTRELEISLWAKGHDFPRVTVYNSRGGYSLKRR